MAGSGREGFAGDGGPAVAADLSSPLAVDLDDDGNLFIVDTDNDRIRCVDAATGMMSTVAGVGAIGPLVDGVSARDASFGRLRDVIVVDSALIVADGNNSLIARIDLQTGTIRHIAGTGVAGYSGDGGAATEAQLQHPYSIALDETGNLFIKDCNSYRLRRVDAETGTISTVAGNGVEGFAGDGGPALEASLSC